MKAVEIAFWVSAGLIVYTHAGYPLLLRAASRGCGAAPLRRPAEPAAACRLIVAAHDEQDVIERKGRERAGARLPARPARGDRRLGRVDGRHRRSSRAPPRPGDPRVRVLDLDAARQGARAGRRRRTRPRGEVLAFSDANALWEPDALAGRWCARSRTSGVGYVCGRLRYLAPDGSNQEGAYWRYETAVRALESRLGSITAGNGAIYAVRRGAYLRLDPRTSHDLSFPFNLVKRGWRAVYEPARARDGAAASRRSRTSSAASGA